ncbi:hypothetical protein NR798_15450 [Archangium gephyra]|uniref:hypothetical protein n=1 Tax=Archangium gephyra TaxID=48 RepID=UPI0035D46BD0
MKTYEDDSQSPDGWNVTSTLKLEDDGRFSYSEGWTDYTNASLSGGAAGTWRRGSGAIIFRAEEVYGTMYFPWAKGQELIARLQDDALDFGHGWTLRPPSPPSEYIVKTPVRNDGAVPLPPVLEPWGTRHTLAPGERVEVVAQGRWREGEPKVERRADSPVKPLARPPSPRFVPRTPSPELAALLRRWVEEVPTDGMINRLCKENDAIPLDCTEIYLWVLRTDGQVLGIDHESFAQRAEPEEDAEVAYGKIKAGARVHPELLELLPPHRGTP